MAIHTSTNSPDCGCSDGGSGGGGGGSINQNNMFVVVEIANTQNYQNPPDTNDVAAILNGLANPFIFSEIHVPVIGVLCLSENRAVKYYFAFKQGKGTYGNGGTAFEGSMLHCFSERRYTFADFSASLNALVTNLGDIVIDFLEEMNSADRDFSNPNLEYIITGVSYGVNKAWVFIGDPGFYGGDGTEITAEMLMEIREEYQAPSTGFKTAFGLVTTAGQFQNNDLIGASLVVQITSSATGPQEGIFGIDSATGTVYNDNFYIGYSYSVIYK